LGLHDQKRNKPLDREKPEMPARKAIHPGENQGKSTLLRQTGFLR